MKTEAFSLSDIPVLLYGAPSARVWLHVHGKMGYKEEAERFAEIACPRGWQVLSLDLPEHGQREGSSRALYPLAGGAGAAEAAGVDAAPVGAHQSVRHQHGGLV